MSVRRVLVVRGVRTTDELQALGMPMAQRYSAADVVALVGSDNLGVLVKGADEATLVELVDADPAVGRCQRAVDSVKRAAEERGREVIVAVGTFLYYWPLALNSVETVSGGIERGECKMVEEAAELFIRCDLGNDLDKLQGDESSSDAGGHAAN